MLIINADDWGRSAGETDAILSCYEQGRITSASAMVFMADSERAARMAIDTGLDVGLHLNLSERFTGNGFSGNIKMQHNRIIRFLRLTKYSHLLYYPFLRESISEVFKVQMEEFHRLYGKSPSHVDGHHHMHLCANMVVGNVIPAGVKVRRNFSFWPGEKGIANRAYRRLVDDWLARQHRMPDYFFGLPQCIQQSKWKRVEALAQSSTVELMTHPAVATESEYLKGETFNALLHRVPRGTYACI